MKRSIYLDNNATTIIDPVIAQKTFELSQLEIANPASQHSSGRRALRLLEDAKSELLELCGANSQGMDSAEVVITSGGTEANNLAIIGHSASRPGITIVSGSDHPSVIEAAKAAATAQCPCKILPVDSGGICDMSLLESWLKDDAARISLVSIMLGNNETGVIQDLRAVCNLCQQYCVPVHSDIVQAIGKIPVSMKDLGLSAMTLTGHKIHGPVGVGALITDKSFSIQPMLVGGGQQLGIRPGTEQVIPTVALAMAVRETCNARVNGTYEAVAQMRNKFESALCEATGATVVAAESNRLPHTTNIVFPGVDRQALHMALDLEGVACSTGSACSSGSSRPSGVLVAMGLPSDMVSNSLRFSFSKYSTASEAESACQTVIQVVLKLQQ